MKKLIVVFSLILVSFSSSIYARDIRTERHVQWDKSPILVSLTTGKLMMVDFPHPVSLIKPSFEDMKVRNLSGVLYLTSLDSFEDKELLVKDNNNGEVFILTLSSSKNSKAKYTRVIVESDALETNKNTGSEVKNAEDNSVNYLSLTRFVIQRLYSSARLTHPLEGVQRIAMHTKRHIPLLYNNQIIASPIASWRSQFLFVTAVQLQNTQGEDVRLDAEKDIRGDWKSAAFYPRDSISKRGDKHDSTLAILISNKPFNTALSNVYGGEE